MYLLDGKPISPDSPFSHNGVVYPANWIRLSTQEELASIGITEVQDPPPYDGRFYFGYDDQGNLIPRDHTQLVEEWSNETKRAAYGILLPTDWHFIREVDDGTPVDAAIKTWRESVRTACVDKINSIQATTTTPELAAYVTSAAYAVWPLQEQPQPVADTPVIP